MINKPQTPNKHLLENQQVVEEIRRHLWIESEKAGYDIGFAAAARDWLEKFSTAWMEHYMPAPAQPVKPKAPARRSAKSLKAVGGSKTTKTARQLVKKD